jgi:putative nucleotidyltransferase with HDIG domain
MVPDSFAQNEDAWFGRRDEEAEAAASASLAATAARIVGAKPFPIAAKRLEELTRTPHARIEQVVLVLESDPALSARLLRLVNSAGYGLKVRCTSVRHAAVLVGTRRLNQVATTAAILDLFESSNSLAAELLEHASVVGSLCRYLAVHLGLPHDELFTCGFLHDIGKMMLLDTEREVYPALLQQFSGQADVIHEQERRLFGFDHAILGAHVLTAWNIPEPVPKVIAWHHQPGRALQDSLLSAMVQTLRLADLLAYELGRRTEKEGVPLVASSEAAQYLDISEPQLSAMWNDLGALRERSRARSHGEVDLAAAEPRLEVPNSLRPRGSMSPRSLKPSMAPTHGPISTVDSDAPGSLRPPASAKERPNNLSCVVCAAASYGNLCQACGGHVCPEHQEGADEWCSLCVDEFADFKRRFRVAPAHLTLVGTAVLLSLMGAAASAWSAGNTGLSALLAPLLLGVMWAIVLPIAARLWTKLRFMRGLSPRTPPLLAQATEQDALGSSEEERELSADGQLGRSGVPSVVPEYDRSTLHTSVAPPIEPYAAGLAAMLPPAEKALEPRVTSEPPPSQRGPLVIRVDVPSLQPSALSAAPRPEIAAANVPLSVIPEAAAISVAPTAPSPAIEPMPAAADVVPADVSRGATPEESEARVRISQPPEPAPASTTLAPPQEPAPPVEAIAEVAAAAPRSEASGVRHVLLRNEPGVLRDACSEVVLNRCS